MAIMTCVCSHPFQDERYGDKRRVANERGVAAKTGAGASPGHRCTVCGEAIIKVAKPKKVKKAAEPDKKGKKGR